MVSPPKLVPAVKSLLLVNAGPISPVGKVSVSPAAGTAMGCQLFASDQLLLVAASCPVHVSADRTTRDSSRSSFSSSDRHVLLSIFSPRNRTPSLPSL